MSKFSILFFILLFCAENGTAQAQVFDPGILDGVYVKENTPINRVRQETNAYLLNYFLPELLNAEQKRKLNSSISLQKKNYAAAPLEIQECIYFNGAVQQALDSTGNFALFNSFFSSSKLHFPSSLRFYTNETKNNVDSLYSMNLYPDVSLEKYTQPFYFKKCEVTNAEYWEFVKYVRDSVARRVLVENGYEDDYLFSDEYLYKHGYSREEDLPNGPYRPLNTEEKVLWDGSGGADYKAALQSMYLPEYERYYRRREIDVRKLDFEYYYDSTGNPLCRPWKWTDESSRRTFKGVVNVYPDTSCWFHDFSFLENEISPNLYFWHPAYANYPVVGINYIQAKAFLNWKTIEEQKKLDAKGIKLKVQYDLPTEIEWEIAATSLKKNKTQDAYGKNYLTLADHSWLTDLMLDSNALVNEKVKVIVDSTSEEIVPVTYSERSSQGVLAPNYPDAIYIRENIPSFMRYSDTTIEKGGKKFRIKTSYYYWSEKRTNYLNADQQTFNLKYSPDSYILTAPADLQKVKKIAPEFPRSKVIIDNSEILTQLDGNGISFMGGNVSEWLKNDYADWRPAFLMRLKMLRSINASDAQLEYQRELYFDSRNAKNGKLVRGGNWFDERRSSVLGKNPAGANAKCFVNPEEAHCTLGFRYVVRVVKK